MAWFAIVPRGVAKAEPIAYVIADTSEHAMQKQRELGEHPAWTVIAMPIASPPGLEGISLG